jgi:hypothetical protein
MQEVVDVLRGGVQLHFNINVTNLMTLQESLLRLNRECVNKLVVQCITELLVNPMRPAQYMAAGEVDKADWQTFPCTLTLPV